MDTGHTTVPPPSYLESQYTGIRYIDDIDGDHGDEKQEKVENEEIIKKENNITVNSEPVSTCQVTPIISQPTPVSGYTAVDGGGTYIVDDTCSLCWCLSCPTCCIFGKCCSCDCDDGCGGCDCGDCDCSF